MKLNNKDTVKDMRTKHCSVTPFGFQTGLWVSGKFRHNLIIGTAKKLGPRNTALPEQRIRKGIA